MVRKNTDNKWGLQMNGTVICHHGIKGQKWGIRRFQNEDGSLTPEGEKRYYVDSDGTVKKKTHQMKLQEKYKAQGMKDDEAFTKARRVDRTEKALAGIATAAVLVTTIAVGKNHIDNYKDQVISAGTDIQRMDTTDKFGEHNEFFGSVDSTDKKIYQGLFGKWKADMGMDVYKKNMSPTEDIKVAAPKKAKKIFEELRKKDKDFADEIGDINYDEFNQALVGSNHGKNWAQKFYNALKSQGYGAIQDINDQKYSGYEAKKPLIFFGDSLKKMQLNNTEKFETGEKLQSTYDKALKLVNNRRKARKLKETVTDYLKTSSPQLATFAIVTAGGATSVYATAGENKALNTYKVTGGKK